MSGAPPPKFNYFDFAEERQKTVNPEVRRLLEQHTVIKDAMGGELLTMRAQLPQGGLRVLDSGTADGHWLRDLATSFSPDASNTYVGTDLSIERLPIPETPATTYSSQDINQPWPADWQGTFDIVHQRFTLGPALAANEKGKQAVTRLVGLLKPGGWIQLVEGEYRVGDDEAEPVRRTKQTIRALMDFYMGGDSLSIPNGIKGWLEDAGCVDAQERIVDVWRGRNENPEVAKMGVDSIVEIAKGMGYMVKTADEEKLKSIWPHPKEDAEALPQQLEAELTANGGDFPIRIIWARKPPTA